MQSPAIPFGDRGIVTAVQHFELETYRVRNCDPDAGSRWPLERASLCLSDRVERDCRWQLSRRRVAGRLLAAFDEWTRSFRWIDGVERQRGCELPVTLVMCKHRPCRSARHRNF